MKKRILQRLTPVLLLALFLHGCGGSSSKYSAVTAAETAAAGYGMNMDNGYDAYPTAAPAAAPFGYMNDIKSEEVMEEGAYWEEDADENLIPENEVLDTSPQQISSVNDTPSAPLKRKLIRNMDLTVETTDFDTLISSIQAKVTEFQGYIERSDVSGNSITNQGRPSKKYASMTLRIPAEKLDSFISQVEAAGNITYKSENVSDVTLQYSDIESRIKTLRMEQERLWELLAKAESTESIVLLEERLTEVSSEIESYESRMRYLDNSVTYSTINLDIHEVDIESPTQPETAWQQIQRGFTRNLIALMDNLTQFIIHLLSSLPVLLFLAFLIFLVVIIVRRIIKRRKTKTPPPLPISQMQFSGSTGPTAAPQKPNTEMNSSTQSTETDSSPQRQNTETDSIKKST